MERVYAGLEDRRSVSIIREPVIWWRCRERDSWFAYPYWLDDRLAPDFARTVDIHRKPGYDPCELFFDPSRIWPQGRAILQLAQRTWASVHSSTWCRSTRAWCAAATACLRSISRTSRY